MLRIKREGPPTFQRSIDLVLPWHEGLTLRELLAHGGFTEVEGTEEPVSPMSLYEVSAHGGESGRPAWCVYVSYRGNGEHVVPPK